MFIGEYAGDEVAVGAHDRETDEPGKVWILKEVNSEKCNSE